jgi:hypothetical protein
LPLDHVGWLVADLSAASLAFGALGFAVTQPGTLKTASTQGVPADVGQRSAHVMFGDTYLELTALAPGASPEHLRPYRDQGGLIILALRVEDAAAAYHVLDGSQLGVTSPSRSERPVAYPAPADQGIAGFHWFMCAAEDFPELLVCCVEHLTPSLVFQPLVSEHANGVSALTRVFVLEPDPLAAARRFRTLVTAVAPAADEARGSIIALDAAAAAERFPGVEFGTSACAIGVGLKVADLDHLSRRLSEAGVAFTAEAERIWCAGPAGSVLEFHA